jgi:hypothetical protein
MKIVNRETFLKMPAETVYSEYKPCAFDQVCIKGETTGNDFYVNYVTQTLDCKNSEEFVDILFAAEKSGDSFPLDFDTEGRDGMFDDEQLFAVWDKQDIEGLIERLKQTIADQPRVDESKGK